MYLLVVDTETTGVPEDEHDTVMIEFACALYNTERKTTLWQLGSVVYKLGDNPCEDINGITKEDLADGTDISDVDRVFGILFEQGPRPAAIVAHNAEFDKHYVTKSGELDLGDVPWVDSYEIEYPNQRGSKRLAHLAADHGIFGQQTHRALDDVLMLCNLLSKVNNLEEQVQDLLKPRGEWQAGTNYHQRHLAKEHGFQWDPDRKMWVRKWPLDKPWPDDLPFKVRLIREL